MSIKISAIVGVWIQNHSTGSPAHQSPLHLSRKPTSKSELVMKRRTTEMISVRKLKCGWVNNRSHRLLTQSSRTFWDRKKNTQINDANLLNNYSSKQLSQNTKENTVQDTSTSTLNVKCKRNGLPLALWSLPRVFSQKFLQQLKTTLFGRAGAGSASE